MVKYGEILRLAAMGVGQNSIAFSCGCAQSTVSDVLRAARARKASWPLPEEMDDAAVRSAIYPAKESRAHDKAPISHERIASELRRRGMTMSLLWNECCDSAVARGEEPCMYSAFCKRRREWAQRRDVRTRIDRKPAEAIRVDWVGDTAEVVDPDAGEVLEVFVLAACPPCSNYLYAEGFYGTDEEAWVRAHVRMFAFFGGATPILAPDSRKTAAAENAKDALVVNERYRRMSERYGCAVAPARVRRPRDKGGVEMGVGIIERQATTALRNRRSVSLAELNRALIDQVAAISSRPFQKREGSREGIFLGQGKPMLIPLPAGPYEMSARREATVNLNCRVAFEGARIAVHERAGRRGGYRTDPNRMPDAHRDFAEWNGDRFRRWASGIGESCAKAIDAILAPRKIEQQSHRSRRGVPSLSKSHGDALLEEACAKALLRTPGPGCKTVRGTLAALASERRDADEDRGAYLRGGDCCKRLENGSEGDEQRRRTNRPWTRCTR